MRYLFVCSSCRQFISYPCAALILQQFLRFLGQLKRTLFIHWFSYPLSSGVNPEEDSKYLAAVFSNLWSFCLLHTKTGPSKVGDVVTPPGPWSTVGLVSRGRVQQTCLTNFSWNIMVIWPNQDGCEQCSMIFMQKKKLKIYKEQAIGSED